MACPRRVTHVSLSLDLFQAVWPAKQKQPWPNFVVVRGLIWKSVVSIDTEHTDRRPRRALDWATACDAVAVDQICIYCGDLLMCIVQEYRHSFSCFISRQLDRRDWLYRSEPEMNSILPTFRCSRQDMHQPLAWLMQSCSTVMFELDPRLRLACRCRLNACMQVVSVYMMMSETASLNSNETSSVWISRWYLGLLHHSARVWGHNPSPAGGPSRIFIFYITAGVV